MTREAYEAELQALQQSIVEMSSMVDKAIVRSTDALKRQDVDLANQVIEDDRAINERRWKTESEALTMIATQAPMASDLRRIASAIHIAIDLERMGDHAAGNAKIVLLNANEPPLKPLVDIPRMAELARKMLADSISAYIATDAELARSVVPRDDEVDDLYNQVYRELLTFMMADTATINRASHLLWAAHNIERIADRTTNICESVVYAATGMYEDLESSNY